MQKVKTLLRFLLGVPLTIVAFAFIGKFIYDARSQLIANFAHFDSFGIFIGVIFFLLFFFFRSLLWKAVLNEDGYHPSTMESTYLLAVSELKRYIPGSVLAIVGRVSSFSTYKIPSKTILKMIFFESVLFLLASVVVSLPAAIYLYLHVNLDLRIVFLILFIVFLICLILFLFAKEKAKKLLIEFPKYTKALLLMCCAWAFFGIGNFLILNSFYRLDPTNIIPYISFFVFSWLVGYVVVIMPLGLGVREGFLTYQLSFSTPLGIAAALSIISRIAFVICEILFVVLTYTIYKHWRPRPKIEASDAILWGLIGCYTLYFAYIRLLPSMNMLPTVLIILQTLILSLGVIFVYETCLKVIGNKNLSLIFAASYLLNPIIQSSNVSKFNTGFLINEAAVIGIYAVVIITLNKLLIKRRYGFNIYFSCILVLLISITLTYFYGILPGSAHPLITSYMK